MISQKRQVGAALSADRTRPAGVDGEFITVEEFYARGRLRLAVSHRQGSCFPERRIVPRELCLQPDTNCNDHSFGRETNLHLNSAEAGRERAAAMSRG